jgi:molybdenum cofactor cytidylyltransferase
MGGNSNNNHYGMILAAGYSTRMGQCKALLPWIGGTTLLSYQVKQLLTAGITPIVVLAPHNSDLCVEELRSQQLATEHLPYIITENPQPQRGKTTSILTGLAGLPHTVESLIISAVDQPRPADVYRHLLQAHLAATDALITLPIHQQRVGHPPVFSPQLLPNLSKIHEETLGLRQILREFADYVQTIEIPHADIFLDLNTPDTYRTAIQTRLHTP